MAPIPGKPALTGRVWAEHFPTSTREERTILIASNHRKLSRQLDNRKLGFLEENSALKEKFEFLCFWNRSSPTVLGWAGSESMDTASPDPRRRSTPRGPTCRWPALLPWAKLPRFKFSLSFVNYIFYPFYFSDSISSPYNRRMILFTIWWKQF